MSIQVGDTVEIPKGVEVLDGHTYGDFRHFTYMKAKASARASKVKVEAIVDVSPHWWNLLDTATHDEVRKRTGIHCSTLFDNARGIFSDDNGPISYDGPQDRIGRRWSAAEVDRWLVERGQRVPIERQPEIDALFDELKARVVARFGDMKFVVWSGDKKSTLLANVVPAEAAAPKAPKEQKITKRRLMVPGARFRFTAEVPIRVWMENPEIARLIAERDKNQPDRNSHRLLGNGTVLVTLGGGVQQTAAQKAEVERIQKLINDAPRQVNVMAAKVPAGVLVEITGKPEASKSYYSDKESNGLMVPMKVIADGPIRVAERFLKGDRWRNPIWARDGISLPYSQIEKAIEVVEGSVPEVIVWALRDRETGEYFGGWETERHSYGNRQTNTPKMSKTFSGSKKYKNLSAVKASIMDFTGYHSGLEQEGYVEEWVAGGEKKIDLPSTWEAVAVDKTTNNVKRSEDVVDWYAGLMRLRGLTAQFGSAVRGLYKKVEGKEGFEAIVVFKLADDMDEDDPAIVREVRLIEEAVEQSGAEKTKRETTPRSMAYAVASQMDATLILLGYQGSGTAKAYDIANLQEIVPEKKA